MPTGTSGGAASRSAFRPSRWWRSGPAGGPSRGWTRWAGSTSVRRARGADPGPACYDRGGERPTVTDADVVLGRIDPAEFAGGSVRLAPERAGESIRGAVGAPLELTDPLAALSVSEMVDENMANAARVHAVEWGKDISARTMIAFGGAAPLHAARLAQKLDVGRVIVPSGAGVGSAIGMLRAAVSYEVGAEPVPSPRRLQPRGSQRPCSRRCTRRRGRWW